MWETWIPGCPKRPSRRRRSTHLRAGHQPPSEPPNHRWSRTSKGECALPHLLPAVRARQRSHLSWCLQQTTYLKESAIDCLDLALSDTPKPAGNETIKLQSLRKPRASLQHLSITSSSVLSAL